MNDHVSIDARRLEVVMDHHYRVIVGCCAQIDILGETDLSEFFGSFCHNLLKATLDHIELGRPLQKFFLLRAEVLELNAREPLDDFEQIVFALLLPLFIESAWASVIQIFQPLEIAHCHAPCVRHHVRNKVYSLLQEDLFSFYGGWTVGCLNHKLALEFVGVGHVDGLLVGGWDEDVAWGEHRIVILTSLNSREAHNRFFFIFEIIEILRTNAFLAVDAAVELADSHQLGSLFSEVLGSVIAYIPKALNHKSLSFQTSANSEFLRNLLIAQNLFSNKVNSEACAFFSALNASLSK